MEIWYNLILLALLWSGMEACDSCGTCLQPPDFISNFTTMTAQSDTKSTLTIHHDLGEVPVKVEVQVRPPPGRPDTEYVFPGVGSAQADDDLSLTYGGVVYKYNSQQIVLTVPKKSNGSPTGTTIYTGDNTWIGPKSQIEQTAEVRVKLWTNCTFPVPDFESTWFLMVSQNATHSYKEIEHGLGEEPEYVSVQIKHFDKDWYTDGIGSSSRKTKTTTNANWGGLIYGSNDTHVRTWVPHLYNGKIFSAGDGWGLPESWVSGWVKVRVWKTFEGSLVFKSTTFVNSGLSVGDHQISTPYLDISSGMIDVKIIVNDGSNSGFSFPGTGAVQNVQPDESYGGVVYSYSTNGFRFWHPHLSTVGSFHQNFLVLIDNAWGGGVNQQASTSGDLVIKFWNYTRDGERMDWFRVSQSDFAGPCPCTCSPTPAEACPHITWKIGTAHIPPIAGSLSDLRPNAESSIWWKWITRENMVRTVYLMTQVNQVDTENSAEPHIISRSAFLSLAPK